MALRHTRLISKVFPSRVSSTSSFLPASSKRFESQQGSGGAPYRPYPVDYYSHPITADYWSQQGYKPQSAADDEYQEEQVYLAEIEERLKTYDKKYRDSDKVKEMYNEFGWTAIDDRATYVYGGSLGGEQYGPGKKLDPAHYVTPEWCNVNRKSIPPIQYLTAEQIRRSRGSLASTRELPPETDSIWKYWNGYSAIGVFTTIMITKEWYVIGCHDMLEAICTWALFGIVGATAGDWFAWWHTLLYQENYDREYFPLLAAVKKYNAKLEAINSKPNEKRLMFQMQKYRELIAEKVLDKTVTNRLGRMVDATIAKLDAKINEEAMVKKDAENGWKQTALRNTVDYFEDESVRQEFMKDALASFCSGDTAKLTKGSATVSYQTDIFQNQFKNNFALAQQAYLDDQRAKGTLSAVFLNESERVSQSSAEKAEEYQRKIQEWENGRNPVQATMPTFA